MTEEALLALGSNIGDKEKNLDFAIKSVRLVPTTVVLDISNFYETEPFRVPDKQDNYINCCIKIKTALSSEALLGVCLGIEAAMGRKREYKSASRIIDIDLLLYGDKKKDTDELTIPHPGIKDRPFVLLPMNDICYQKSFRGFDFSEAFNKIDKKDIRQIIRFPAESKPTLNKR